MDLNTPGKCRYPVALLALLMLPCALPAEHPQYRIATFSQDITIPLNHRCMGILPTKSQQIVDPLEAHGFVLIGLDQPVVLVALDWCEVRNGAYDQWRAALAKAAGTDRQRVMLACLHQHDAPVTDTGAQKYLDEVGLAGELFDTEFHDQCIQRVSAALSAAMQRTQPITHVGVGQAQVAGVASSRRVVTPDGKVKFDRYSRSGGDPFHSTAPDGEIDPFLKTVSFWNDDKAIVSLHAYATHPMSYYGQGGVSADFVGMARRQFQRKHPQTKQIYVSGCSGDVTAGKYNDGAPATRAILAERILQAMVLSTRQTNKVPVEQFVFRNAELEIPFHRGDEFLRERMETTLRDVDAKIGDRILAAMGLSSLDRVERGQHIDLPCLDLGPAQIVLFPGEAFVGYQLMAQRMTPRPFVMSIGYGECWPGYIPTKQAFDEGFGHGWRWADRGSEAAIRQALSEVLR
jgi:hypothetical protein